MSFANTAVAEQFEDAAQQRHAATFGMWVFLATEVLFFGALFLGYTVYRVVYPQDFRQAAAHTLVLIGSINTGVLLVSSFTMVLAVRASELRQRAHTFLFLLATAFLGVVFLGLKAYEYSDEIREGLLPTASFHIQNANVPHARIFFSFYFVMTGLHAIHVTIGVLLLGLFSVRAIFTERPERFATAVDLLGLYWHFVDIVWVFLFPLIYLIGRHT
jgi:cytochrome c oxidase subunit 3